MSDRLSEIEGRLAAATPGPWHADHDADAVWNDSCVHIGEYGWVASGPDGESPAYDVDTEQGRADAELIAHAPADLAALVAVVRAVQAEHQEVKTYDWADTCPLRTDDAHAERYHVEDDDADECICLDSPTGDATCSSCVGTGEGPLPWPCPTAAALEPLR